MIGHAGQQIGNYRLLRQLDESDFTELYQCQRAYPISQSNIDLLLLNTTIATFRDHTEPVRAVAWSPDGKYIASAGDDRRVYIWSAIDEDKICNYSGLLSACQGA